jgi:TonB-linked SusC/RagA family outer membrane protein
MNNIFRQETAFMFNPNYAKVMDLTAYCHPLAGCAAIKHRQQWLTKMMLVMKITAVILLAACLQVSARGVSQTLTLSFKNAPLEKVLNEIQKQSGFSFFYEDGLLKNANPVDIAVSKASLAEALDICFKNQPFTYKIINNAVSIRRKAIEAAMQLSPVTGDPVTVSGKVTDPQGNPLVGANVKVKGSNVGTTTDNLGRFTLANLDADAVLEISFVGHDAQAFSVKGRSFLTVALVQKQSILDETVVIAYGTSSRRFTTGNISSVKAADIEKLTIQNPLIALQGRVPGVEVTQLTGMPGGGSTIRIQGINSIKSGLDPLIVVDGVPVPSQFSGSIGAESIIQGGSPLNYINAGDVESIDVLKDADATAIYGSRAANGAILITTKKGKAGRTRINIGFREGWGKVSRKLDMMNTRQYLDMRYEALRNDGIIWQAPTYTANDLKVWDTTRYTDWQKVLIGGTAKYTMANASISGGTSGIQYLIGSSYNRQTTVFPGASDDWSGTMHFNVNGATPNQKFKVQLSGSYMYDQNHLPGVDLTSKAILAEPNAPSLFNEDGTLNWAPNAAGISTWTNPLAYTASLDFNNAVKNLISNAMLSYQVLNGLDIRTSLGYTSLQTQTYYPLRLEALPPEKRPNGTRSASFGDRNMNTWIIEPMVQYTGRVSKGRVEALVGTTIQKTGFSHLGISASGFPTDELIKALTTAKSITISSSTSGITRYNALYARLNCVWDEKYLVNLTARRDGSNKFGDNNKFNNFGSVGVGWIFSQIKWVNKNLPFLSFGKLRTSYGVTGNDQIPDFSYLGIYGIYNPTILYQNSVGLFASNIPNPYLQWEETRKWQTGIDVGVFSDRALLGITFARNRSSNQLISYLLPSLTGFTSITKNLPATIQNTSLEFTLSSTNIKSRTFTWISSINLTVPKNKLVSFPGIELSSYASGLNGIIIGQPIGAKAVYPYAGISPANGKYLSMDRYGNVLNSLDLPTSFVTLQSIFYGGVNNKFTYKAIQLEVLFQFVQKKGPRDFYWSSGSAYPGQFSPTISNQPVTVLNRWQKPGDVALVAPYSTTSYSTEFASTDAFYSYESSFLRLKNVSLNWQIPARIVKQLHLQNAQIYFSGQNLAVFTKYRGIDPESGSTNLPPLQIWTIGMNVEL